MKGKTAKFLAAILACGALTLLATACGKKKAEDNGSSVSINEGVNLQSGISFKTLTVDGTNVYGKVSNSTETFSFIDEVSQTANSRFIVSLDICGLQKVATKMIPLEVGDNQVYITEIVDDEPINVYTLIVRRRPMYEITFNTNGGTSVQSQTVEEDSCAIMPLKEPTRLGYGFNGWNYDFTKSITGNTVINAKWESIFTISGNTITGVTDYGKNNYKQLNIPSKIDGITITNIGDGAFEDCTWLTGIKIITIPESVTSIGNYAFYGCEGLTSITIPDSVMSIGNQAFYGCESLTNIIVPNSVTSIGGEVFYGCEGLTSITIPDSVTSIERRTFAYCRGLTSITLGNCVTNISYDAFHRCTSLMSITVGENNTAYKSIDGNLYTKNGKTLVQYAIGKTETSFTIPESVTNIGVYAFYGCTSLTSITIPDSVTSIGALAFYRCENLTIYCEAESQPSGWDSNWNYSSCSVVWGHKAEV